MSTTQRVTNDAFHDGLVDTLRKAVQRLVLLIDNACLGAAGLADATTAADVKTTATVAYRVDGKQLSKGATDNLWTLTGAVLSAGQVNKWLLCLDASGTASVVEGIPASTAAGVTFADVVSGGDSYPAPGPSKAVIGIVTVTVNSSTFTPGTTSLAAGTITVDYHDGYDAAAQGAPFPLLRV